MTFDDYQQKAHETAVVNDIDVYSLGLIGEAGGVASAIKKYKRDAPSRDQLRRDIEEELGDVLWYLAEVASRTGISLSAIAAANLQKTQFLFKGRDKDFDEGFPDEQKFPRKTCIQFVDDGTKLVLQADGRAIGDALTDNAYEDDGYRYHDAFHLAYMVVLGWSPVFRKLLQRKRRDRREIDEVEDGARARALEEGISILVFSQSIPPRDAPSLFSDRTQIPFWLLEGIKKMTVNHEVSAKSVEDWREAISAGFRIFDELRFKKGGEIACDLDAKTLKFVMH